MQVNKGQALAAGKLWSSADDRSNCNWLLSLSDINDNKTCMNCWVSCHKSHSSVLKLDILSA